MMKNSIVAAGIATAYLIIYCALFQIGASMQVLGLMFLFSPVVIIWMTLTILRDKKHPVRDLEKGEEWGYQDRDKSTLGVF